MNYRSDPAIALFFFRPDKAELISTCAHASFWAVDLRAYLRECQSFLVLCAQRSIFFRRPGALSIPNLYRITPFMIIFSGTPAASALR